MLREEHVTTGAETTVTVEEGLARNAEVALNNRRIA